MNRILISCLFILSFSAVVQAQCSSVTPTFTLDLSGNPNSSSTTPSSSRNGTCCNGTVPCVKIVVLLNPNAMALQLTPTGADPGGALTYEFNCDGIQIPGGTPVCLAGTGPQTLTICKVGNNPNAYSVVSIPKPKVQDTLHVRNGCTTTLVSTGYSVPTITWTAINAGTNTALFNSYLSCTSGCATTVVTPTTTVPVPFIDYVVSGFGQAPCQAAYYSDTARVFFYNDLAAPISPTTICFGSISAVLNPTPTGGKSPYTYTWSTGSNSSSITVGAGNYTLTLSDDTGCPPITSTVAVGIFTLPISANTGADPIVCKTSPTVAFNATVTSASGGTWSAPSGTFLPSNAALNATYIPAGTAVSNGSVQLILGTTGNAGCEPDEDTVIVYFQNQPTVIASLDQTVCANNNLSLHSAVISGYSATAAWAAPGGGTLTPPIGLITNFHPTPAQLTAGFASIVVSTANNGGCPGDSDTISIFFTPAPVVSAGADQLICSNASAQLTGTVSPAPFSGSWTTNGDGTFSSAGTPTTSYTPGMNDISAGTVTLVLHASNLGNCNPVTDTVLLQVAKIATVTVSGPPLICSSFTNVSYSSTVAGASGTGSWSSSGTGAFSTVNNLQSQYILSAADQTLTTISFSMTSTGNGPCPAVTSAAVMTIAAQPTVYAGANQQVCSSPGTIVLGVGIPTITGSAISGTWSSSGAGNLVQGGAYPNATYSVTTSDVSTGSVVFTLTSTNNGICPAGSDTVRIGVVTLPVVTASPNQTICSTAGSVSLSGNVTGGVSQTGLWTTNGNGSFNPGSASLSTQYALSLNDINSGLVNFTLTSTGNGACAAQQATVQVSIVPLATVFAGPNQTICTTQPTIALNGTIQSNTGTGIWSAAGGGALSPSGLANALYSVTSTDINNGVANFTLTSTANGPCPAVTNTMMASIVRQPTVMASATPSLCSNNALAQVSGTVLGAIGTGVWSTAGSGTFLPAASNLTATYSAGPSDISANGVLLTLTSTNHSPCAAASATALVQIQDPPQVQPGPSQLICSNQPTIALTGTVLGTFNTGTWSASGAGVFTPSNAAVTAYSITQNDINNGSVNFTLTSTNNGACPPASNSLSVQITRVATVTASPSQSLCTSSSAAAISGTVIGGSGAGTWSTSGTGQFLPLNSALSASYQVSSADISAGSVLIVLSSANTAPCPTSSDSLTIYIHVPPQVATPPSQTVCSTQQGVALTGTVVNSFNSGLWTSSGTGSLNPPGSVQTNYFFTPADVNFGAVTLTLTSTNDGACASASGTTGIFIARQATIAASSSQTLCSTSNSAQVTGTLTGGSNAVLWTSSGSGAFQPSGASLSSSYLFSNSDIDGGSVLLTLSSDNNGPCVIDSDTLRLYVQRPSVVATGTYAAVCSGDRTIALTGSVSGGQQSGVWSTATGGSFTPAPEALHGGYIMSQGDVQFGNVTLTLTSTNNGACPVVWEAVTIPIVQQVSVVAASDFSACSNEPNLAINATVTGNSAGMLWNGNGSGSIAAPQSALTSYALGANDVNQGTVVFVATALPNGPCPAADDTLQLFVTRRPVVTMNNDTSVCSNQSPIEITGDIASGSGQVLWVSSGTGSFVPGPFVQNTSYAFSAQDMSAGVVYLSLNSVNNGACGSVSSTMTVDIKPSPQAGFSASAYTVTLPADPIILTNQSGGATSYTWEISDGYKANTLNVTHAFASVGFYDIVLAVENDYGCTDTTETRITVISSIRFPTAFTPNGDKLNDTFRPYTDGVTEYELTIYNRWGEMIFKSENLLTGWDGRFQGKVCQQDAYVWKAFMKFFDGRTYEGTGSITLLK